LCNKFLEYTKNDLSSIVFSDECRFHLYQPDSQNFVRRRRGERLNPKHVKNSVKYKGGSIMAWGCISSKGVGSLVFIDETMNAARYKQILCQNLEESVDKMGLKSFIFQHDNAPCHKSKIISSLFEEKTWKVMEWPAQSPDLNPIEHIWAYMKRKLENISIFNLKELELKIKEVWDGIIPDICSNLVDSMPRRAQAIYNAKGGASKY